MVTSAYRKSGLGINLAILLAILLGILRAARRLSGAAVTDRRNGMSLGWGSRTRGQGSFHGLLRHYAVTALHFAAIGVFAGVVTTVVTSCGGDSGTGPPKVSVPSLTTIKFDRAADSVEVQHTSTVNATFFDATGSQVGTAETVWTISDTTVATVSPLGVVSGLRTGTTILTLKADSVTSSIPVVVLPPAVASVTFPTTSFSIAEGDTITIPTPRIVDRTGAVVSGRTPTYAVGYAGGVSVTAAGLVTGVFAGTATVTATVDTVHTVLTFTVLPTAIAKVNLIPTVLDVGVGRNISTQASAYGTAGERLLHRTYTYSIDNTSVATVTSYGLVTGRAAGTATLTVSTGMGSVNVPISVAQIAPGGFKIDVRFVGNVSQAVQNAALVAAARWEQVVSTPLIPYHIVTHANDCGAGVPGVDTTETSLLIIVQSDSIDGRGNTAGLGGPCVLRDDPPQFTALGTVTVDSADVAGLAQEGILVALLTHEMGHILGIGTLWSDGTVRDSDTFFPNTAAGLDGPDPVFIGAAARAAYAQLGFTVDSAQGVPIENVGTVGAGTRGAHWRASVFGHELMTGTLNNGLNPLSRITIAALADFGYTVVPEAADDYSVLNASSPGTPVTPSLSLNTPARGSAATVSVPIRETLRYPRFTVTRGGVMKPLRGSRQASALQ